MKRFSRKDLTFFLLLVLVIVILPLVILTSQSQQNLRQEASEVTSQALTPAPTVDPANYITHPYLLSLPNGNLGKQYTATLSAYDINPSVELTLKAELLPPELSLGTCQQSTENNRKFIKCPITGIVQPLSTETERVLSFSVTVDNNKGGQVNNRLSVIFNNSHPIINPSFLPKGKVGFPYRATINITDANGVDYQNTLIPTINILTGGTGSFRAFCNKERGIQVKDPVKGETNTCLIRGIANVAGTYTVDVTVRDNRFGYATKKYPLIIEASTNPPPVKKIFITKNEYTGGFNSGIEQGLSGADKQCQIAADVAQIGGTWKAWLSDRTGSATTRLKHNPGPYMLFGRKGGLIVNTILVAIDWNHLVSGEPLFFPIQQTEDQAVSPPSTGAWKVWTGTRFDGTATPYVDPYRSDDNNCGNWGQGSSYSSGWYGVNTDKSPSWTYQSVQNCDQKAHLYCLEQ